MTDSITQYVKDITKYPTITVQEEQVLAEQVAQGNQQAYEKLVNANLRLVMKIANDFKNMGVGIDDLIGAGNIGLMNGARKYKMGMGAKFSTFAANHIKHEIKNTISKMSGALSISSGLYQRRKKIRDIASELGEDATAGAVASKYGTSHKKFIADAMTHHIKVSLDDTVGNGSTKTYFDVVEEENYEDAVDVASKVEQHALLSKCLKELNKTEQKVLACRYGLNGGNAMTLREIGDMLGKTYERVRQIEEGALKKLKIAMD
ncbi:MAG: sigma-70 family RNA polymerase sigma factor [Clostridia bacterium]|nr:sigma-70 family RNA polymerase sigma factor [Clostridia bacterium]